MVNKKIRQAKKRQKLKERLQQKKLLLAASDFPFIQNDKVVQYIQRSKVMFIMRGLPGSGKSTIVEILRKKYNQCGICSSDNYFSRNGFYDFNINLLGEAHAYCQDLAKTYCKENKNVVIIDNTNIMRWEAKPYLETAVQNGYVVVTVTPKTAWRWDPHELAQRNGHKVPLEVLKKKVKAFQKMIPLYYGWFLNENDSQSLLQMGKDFFEICLQNCPNLRQVLLENAGSAEDGDETACAKKLHRGSYFKRTGSAGIVHCTSRFCRWGKMDGSRQYHERKLVTNACGKCFTLKITGLTITPRTLCARVLLDKRQLGLWDNDPWNRGVKPTSSNHKGSTTLSQQLDSLSFMESKDSKVSKRSKKTDSSTATHASSLVSKNPFSVLELDSDTAEKESESLEAKKSPLKGDNSNAHLEQGNCAHVTLGYAEGYKAQQSGPDILEIVTTAAKNGTSFTKKLDNATLYYFGDGRCEVKFDQTLEFNSIFSGFY